MTIPRSTQGVGVKWKVNTLNFGEVELELADDSVLQVAQPTYSQQQTTSAGSMTTTNAWRDMPSPGVWAKTSTGPGSNLFTLDTSNGAMTCQSPGLYVLTGQVTFFRGAAAPPFSEIVYWAAYSVNNDVVSGGSASYPWQSNGGSSPTADMDTIIVNLPLWRRASLVVGDVVRVRFRTSVAGVLPTFSVQQCQMFAWKTQ